MVLNSYLPYVMEISKAIREENKVVQLYSSGSHGGWGWSSVNLEHPSTFDTLAMDPKVKKEMIDDLDRFVRRTGEGSFISDLGRPGNLGILLYGPPGTGKSSLAAVMANYLKFHIYDMELSSLIHSSQFKRLFVGARKKSILLTEDIDCITEFENRKTGREININSQLTLSSLLNFIDGIWSSCGDERIIIFTTNHKEKLNPMLLRPGRMDMHIHMSYCTPPGFKILASNYLGISEHTMFDEIEKLMTEVEVTPAEIAGEVMKSDEAGHALGGLLEFLKVKEK